MKNFLHAVFTVMVFLPGFTGNSQSLRLDRRIMVTDTITDGDVTFAASSDDAEQENDEIDALFDDDLDAGWEGAPEDQNVLTTGLRFRQIFIPRGAKIDSAYLILFSHEGKSAEDIARITIVGEATDDSQTFTEDALITARTPTSASLLWEVAEEWEIWQPYRTPDLKALIQEIIDRQGWVSGNALSLLLKGENQGPSDLENAREFESFENISDPEDGGDGQNHPERVPQLVVYYTVSSARLEIPIMVTDTITDGDVTFEASSDDAEQENDEIDSLFDDDLDAGWEGAPEDQNILTAGLRFRHIGIPQDAVIDSAFIVVYSHEGKSAEDIARITLVGEATDDAQTFTEDALITARPATDASVVWEVAEEWEIWQPYRTPDLKGIVQEIVNRDGWRPGNALALILKGENQGPSDLENAREFESYENISDPEDGGDGQNHPERRPRLVVYFSSPNLTSTRNTHTEIRQLMVYPNPARSGWVNLELESGGASQIRIFTLNGSQQGAEQSGFGKVVGLDVSHLPVGIYLIQAIQGKTISTQKLVILK